MFPRGRRLRRRRDIYLVLRGSRPINVLGLTLRTRYTTNSFPRSTVVVGSAVSKRATVRNRIKRQLRHQLAVELKSLRRGVDLMLIVRTPLLKQTSAERLATLRTVLRRARLF